MGTGFLGKLKQGLAASSEQTGYVPQTRPDRARYDQLIDAYARAVASSQQWYYNLKLGSLGEGKAILALKGEEAIAMIMVCFERYLLSLHQVNSKVSVAELVSKLGISLEARYGSEDAIVRQLLRRKLPFSKQDLIELLDGMLSSEEFNSHNMPIGGVIGAIENYAAEQPLDEELGERLERLDGAINEEMLFTEQRRLLDRVAALTRSDSTDLPLNAGEAWSDDAIEFCSNASSTAAWSKLLEHCRNSNPSKPSAKWLKQAASYIDEIGSEKFEQQCRHWFAMVDMPRTQHAEARSLWEPDPNLMLDETNGDVLKGLAWSCVREENPDLARALVKLAQSCYKKVRGHGPRAVRIGNACVYSLSHMPGRSGLYQLAVLKVRIKHRSILQVINRALNTAAEKRGISATELEEMGVPSYGLTDIGGGEETVGEFTALINVTSLSSVELTWRKPDGKTQKTVPAQVKEEYPDELKELRGNLKDIKSMLSVQKQRIEQLFLKEPTWDYPVWRERYLDHPLVGLIARKLIWHFARGDDARLAHYHDQSIRDVSGEELGELGADWEVSLWHPITSSAEEIKQWRERLESLEISQPFKQAHREVYLLTDAERNTDIYSNRFASHIIKQHQFNALATARGWRYTLQGCWDGGCEEVARLCMDKYNLWAEFWVQGVGDYDDTSASGILNYLSTDQVRFYPIRQGLQTIDETNIDRIPPRTLESIPPLVLSEVFRDVDLFVGVCSVGNNPEWSDGGPNGRFYDYWHSYSFGDLSASAVTRKEALERLVPKLKIAPQCKVVGKFLMVEGKRRTYKIHLGSGNIIMEPNNQYLCVVTDPKKSTATNKLYLPFEGDKTLSIILSKAVLLAADDKIKDRTINSQIDHPR